jgi:hypothetical protein
VISESEWLTEFFADGIVVFMGWILFFCRSINIVGAVAETGKKISQMKFPLPIPKQPGSDAELGKNSLAGQG